jgi:hypothetical protein
MATRLSRLGDSKSVHQNRLCTRPALHTESLPLLVPEPARARRRGDWPAPAPRRAGARAAHRVAHTNYRVALVE